MSSVSLGDLAQSFMLKRRSVDLREEMSKLTDELSSGRVNDVRAVLAGNHNYLTGLERQLEVLQGQVQSSVAAYQNLYDRAAQIQQMAMMCSDIMPYSIPSTVPAFDSYCHIGAVWPNT